MGWLHHNIGRVLNDGWVLCTSLFLSIVLTCRSLFCVVSPSFTPQSLFFLSFPLITIHPFSPLSGRFGCVCVRWGRGHDRPATHTGSPWDSEAEQIVISYLDRRWLLRQTDIFKLSCAEQTAPQYIIQCFGTNFTFWELTFSLCQ